jgi:hypothetical protein
VRSPGALQKTGLSDFPKALLCCSCLAHLMPENPGGGQHDHHFFIFLFYYKSQNAL